MKLTVHVGGGTMTTYLPEIYERFSAEFPSVMTALHGARRTAPRGGTALGAGEAARQARNRHRGTIPGRSAIARPEGARGGDRTGGYPPGSRPGYHHGWLSCRARRLPVDQ